MTDIFISYARSTERQAHQVAEALRALGYSVWRDDELPAHRDYGEVIEERLAASKIVVVLWSADAVKSQWVRAEANRAREDSKLVQLTLDGGRLPLPFDQIQCAQLVGWNGDTGAAGWRKVVGSIADLMGMEAKNLSPPTSEPVDRLLAVLPFDNLSGDPDMLYFSDGVSEEILQTVSRATPLKVIGRSSSFQFRGADKAAANVAAELKATHLLDGSVRRSGDRVRITAHLVECFSQTTLWTQRFDRDLSDVFALQDEIAEAVATALRTTFAPTPTPDRIDPEAYDLYLKARLKGDWDSDREARLAAIVQLERVVALAPSFSQAWAFLAYAKVVDLRLFPRSSEDSERVRSEITRAAETALGLDANTGLPYAALSYLQPYGRYADKATLLKRAVAADPGDAQSLFTLGIFEETIGRVKDSLRIYEKVIILDPQNEFAVLHCGSIMIACGRGAEGRQLIDGFLAKHSAAEVNWGALLHVESAVGNWVRFEELVSRLPASSLQTGMIRDVVALGRMRRNPDAPGALVVAGMVERELAATGSVGFGFLVVAASLGLMEETYGAVAKASFDHMFDPQGPVPAARWAPGAMFTDVGAKMRQDIRFVDFCARIGLVDYWLETDRWPDCADEVPYDFRAEAKRIGPSAATVGR